MSETIRSPRPRLWRIAAAALAGLLIGVLVAVQVTSAPPRYRAGAVLALLPGPRLQAEELPAYWEVLSRGQATRTSALVLGQPRWLPAASIDSGEPADSLALAAGAIPDTSLISVTLDADTPKAAELALRSVLQGASGEAAAVSGPFALNIVSAPEGSATSLAPNELPVLVAGGLAGLLLGAGLGLVVERALAGRRSRNTAAAPEPAAGPESASDAEPAPDAEPAASPEPVRTAAPAGTNGVPVPRQPAVARAPDTDRPRPRPRPGPRPDSRRLPAAMSVADRTTGHHDDPR